jgi:hypothetical protein
MPSVVLTSPVYGTSHVGSGTIPGTHCESFKAHIMGLQTIIILMCIEKKNKAKLARVLTK